MVKFYTRKISLFWILLNVNGKKGNKINYNNLLSQTLTDSFLSMNFIHDKTYLTRTELLENIPKYVLNDGYNVTIPLDEF